MAKALIGKSVGDMAVVRTPNGEETVEVLAISYPAS
jgi:transcription elongation GreA/GreB family factor